MGTLDAHNVPEAPEERPQTNFPVDPVCIAPNANIPELRATLPKSSYCIPYAISLNSLTMGVVSTPFPRLDE